MIQILCFSCNTHIANTDVARLDWPLTGEMFDIVYPGWFLRPGPLNLDLFCPACERLPFQHDPYTAGGGAVGKFLNVRGADGKPVLMTVKAVLIGADSRVEPTLMSVNGKDEAAMDPRRVPGDAAILAQSSAQNSRGLAPGGATNSREPDPPACLPSELNWLTEKGRAINSATGEKGYICPKCHGFITISEQEMGICPTCAMVKASTSAFPCPSCGAKKRFHKKGCTAVDVAAVKQIQEQVVEATGLTPELIARAQMPDPHLLAMEARVSTGPERGDPTEQDLRDLERDRERRMMPRPEPKLRPGGGYAPKAAE